MALACTPPLGGIQLAVNVTTGTQVRIACGTGDPNLAATDSSASDLANASTGSIFLRLDGSTSTSLYVKTGVTSVSNPTGVWTGK
jgi:hypothetical protein